MLNTEKTKILHSALIDESFDVVYAEFDDDVIRILHPSEWHRYLGRYLSVSRLERCHDEFDYRSVQVWRATHKHRKIRVNWHVSVKLRHKLFDVCVTPVRLFALHTLPMHISKLQRIDHV